MHMYHVAQTLQQQKPFFGENRRPLTTSQTGSFPLSPQLFETAVHWNPFARRGYTAQLHFFWQPEMQPLQAEIVCEATVRASSRLFVVPQTGFGACLRFWDLTETFKRIPLRMIRRSRSGLATIAKHSEKNGTPTMITSIMTHN